MTITGGQAQEKLSVRAGRVNWVRAGRVKHLDDPDSFWDVVLGSGYRATADALGPEQREQVRERLLAGLRSRAVRSLRTDVVSGTAKRSSASA